MGSTQTKANLILEETWDLIEERRNTRKVTRNKSTESQRNQKGQTEPLKTQTGRRQATAERSGEQLKKKQLSAKLLGVNRHTGNE